MTIFNDSIEAINRLNEVPSALIKSGVNYVATEQEAFIKFIIDSNLLTMAIGLIFAANLTLFIGVLTEFVFAPIIQKISSGKIKDVDKFTVNILGIDFKVGMILKGLINLLIIIIFIYYVYRGTSVFIKPTK
jgi:large-conductance mechanosensitive channel